PATSEWHALSLHDALPICHADAEHLRGLPRPRRRRLLDGLLGARAALGAPDRVLAGGMSRSMPPVSPASHPKTGARRPGAARRERRSDTSVGALGGCVGARAALPVSAATTNSLRRGGSGAPDGEKSTILRART